MVLWWAAAAAALTVLWLLPDLTYFLRFAGMTLRALLLGPRTHLLQTTCYRSRCVVGDCGPDLRRMRPLRYWRELDFARYHFFMVCGLFGEITLRRGGTILQGACSLRHCGDIPLSCCYRIETRLVHWDERCVYLQQRFVTEEEGEVRAECLSMQSITGASVEESVRSVLAGTAVAKPAMEPDLERWIRSMRASSCKLRPPTTRCSSS